MITAPESNGEFCTSLTDYARRQTILSVICFYKLIRFTFTANVLQSEDEGSNSGPLNTNNRFILCET